ncbi:MAG: MBL fold metallo-hydrolase [Elusimicrobiota bacterium]
MSLAVRRLQLGPMANFVYLVADEASKTFAAVDPAWDVSAVFAEAAREGWTLAAVVLTHNHFDHSDGLPDVLRRSDVPVYVHAEDASAVRGEGRRIVETGDGSALGLGDSRLEFVHTPGHTPGSQCLRAGERLLTGDTLFIGACGRVDLPGSDPRRMYASLRKLGALPDDLLVMPGHAYGPRPAARLGDEKRENPYLAGALRLPLERFLKEVDP